MEDKITLQATADRGDKRWQRILTHPGFSTRLEQIEQAEIHRKFCCHGLPHLLDVARIMTIMNGEQGGRWAADVLYAAALVHDIGRVAEYAGGGRHEAEGPPIAREILPACGYTDAETALIADAVAKHNRKDGGGAGNLASLLKAADRLSRPCYACAAREECYWPEEKKNAGPTY